MLCPVSMRSFLALSHLYSLSIALPFIPHQKGSSLEPALAVRVPYSIVPVDGGAGAAGGVSPETTVTIIQTIVDSESAAPIYITVTQPAPTITQTVTATFTPPIAQQTKTVLVTVTPTIVPTTVYPTVPVQTEDPSGILLPTSSILLTSASTNTTMSTATLISSITTSSSSSKTYDNGLWNTTKYPIWRNSTLPTQAPRRP